MLSGPALGAALRSAIGLKKVTQSQVAEEFGVKQSSVAEWLRFGRIHKRHLPKLVAYFSDVVGPSHWGLPPAWHAESLQLAMFGPSARAAEPQPPYQRPKPARPRAISATATRFPTRTGGCCRT